MVERPHEAQCLTPWLARWPESFGDALGLKLELKGREMPVGRYRADLVLEDVERGSLVVVENMYDAADHDHIGKLITYTADLAAAYGRDAIYAVLVAESFNREHRRALSWLNSVTNDRCRFFGVALKNPTGSPQRKPKFSIKAGPTAEPLTGGRDPESEKVYCEWWTKFLKELNESHDRWDAIQPPGRWFVDLRSGSHGVMYEASYEEEDEEFAGTAYFKHEDDDGAPQTFTRLQSRKDAVENKCESKLMWEPEHQRGWAAVWWSREASIDDRAKWDEARSWQVSFMNRLRDAIESVLAEAGD